MAGRDGCGGSQPKRRDWRCSRVSREMSRFLWSFRGSTSHVVAMRAIGWRTGRNITNRLEGDRGARGHGESRRPWRGARTGIGTLPRRIDPTKPGDAIVERGRGWSPSAVCAAAPVSRRPAVEIRRGPSARRGRGRQKRYGARLITAVRLSSGTPPVVKLRSRIFA